MKTNTQNPIKAGDKVETLIAPPHPASFAGTVIAVGDVNGRILVRGEHGIERVYTPESLTVVSA